MICFGAVVYATVPNIFGSGDPLSSTKVNADFSSLDTRVSTIEGSYQNAASLTSGTLGAGVTIPAATVSGALSNATIAGANVTGNLTTATLPAAHVTDLPIVASGYLRGGFTPAAGKYQIVHLPMTIPADGGYVAVTASFAIAASNYSGTATSACSVDVQLALSELQPDSMQQSYTTLLYPSTIKSTDGNLMTVPGASSALFHFAGAGSPQNVSFYLNADTSSFFPCVAWSVGYVTITATYYPIGSSVTLLTTP